MSATGRTEGQRIENDVYETPSWCVRRLLDIAPDGMGAGTYDEHWFEPCAGSGAIVKAVSEWYVSNRRRQPIWDLNEIRRETYDALGGLRAYHRIRHIQFNDILTLKGKPNTYRLAITNPPFGIAEGVIRSCLKSARHVWMLLRVNFLGSEEREEFFGEFAMPDVYVLPNRPPFVVSKKTGKVGTDATEYAWMHWAADGSQAGIVRRLALTPNEVRRAAREEIQRLHDRRAS